MNFAETVACALSNDPELRHRLAEEFEVAGSTVKKWANGTAKPHPRVQTKVIVFLGYYIEILRATEL